MRVDVFDRVLDGEDVHVTPTVDVIDERRERRRLARSGGARDEHETLWKVTDACQRGRQPQILGRRDCERNRTERHRQRALLHKAIAAEAVSVAVREREVDLLLGLELLTEIPRQHGQDRRIDLTRIERLRTRDRAQLPVDAHARWRLRRQQQVGRAEAHHFGDVRLDGCDVDCGE